MDWLTAFLMGARSEKKVDKDLNGTNPADLPTNILSLDQCRLQAFIKFGSLVSQTKTSLRSTFWYETTADPEKCGCCRPNFVHIDCLDSR